jgi:hypothetical protein
MTTSEVAEAARISCAEQRVTGPTLAVVINSLAGEAEGGAAQIN